MARQRDLTPRHRQPQTLGFDPFGSFLGFDPFGSFLWLVPFGSSLWLVPLARSFGSFPDEAIAQLYLRRWSVELFFRDIKTTLGLDVLRCQSPELIEKEIALQVIAYNLVRALMLEAAWTHDVAPECLSFKGTIDTLRQWTPLMAPAMFAFKRARQELLRIIAADLVPSRPDRVEPRARKRRPKSYQFLTSPRRKMVVSPSRALK